jgi:galactitol-specific phosphotransferase system IIC component
MLRIAAMMCPFSRILRIEMLDITGTSEHAHRFLSASRPLR